MANVLPRLGIVAALPAEARCLGVRDAPPGEPVSVGDGVLLIRCGIGRRRAERAALDLRQAGAGALLTWGTAAALDPHLEHGDLVLASDVVSHDGNHLGVDMEWHRRFSALLATEGRFRSGSLVETDEVLRDADDKLRLRTLSGALIADMESAAVAAVAHDAGLPMLIVRAVSDTVATRVPGCALAAVDGNGDVDVLRCLWRLARAPSELASLLRLAKGFRAACARLERVAERARPDFQLCAAGRLGQSRG